MTLKRLNLHSHFRKIYEVESYKCVDRNVKKMNFVSPFVRRTIAEVLCESNKSEMKDANKRRVIYVFLN